MAADLTFRIGAELSEIKGALASLKSDFAAVNKSAQQAGGQNAFSGLDGKLEGAVGTVGRLVAGFVTLTGLIKLIGAADELNTLNARLKIATSSVEEYTRAQTALFELSQRTRSSLGETVNLYSRIAQATKDAGVGQETLLQVVETINQAVQLSGASTQAAEAALVQLGQGLASGTLRGEELNSILEQTPALADAIAKGMKITRGELRQYGQDGKLTAEQVIKALQAQKDVVAEQFAQLPLTVGQSVTLLKNAGLQLLGAFDGSTAATGGLARSIKSLADFLSGDEAIGSIIEFATGLSNAFEQTVADVQNLVQTVREATKDITGDGLDLIDILQRAFIELPQNIRAAIKIVAVRAAELFDGLVSYARFVKDNFKAIFTDDTQDAAFARFQSRNKAIADAAQSTVEDALAEREKALSDAKSARAQAQAARDKARKDTGANGLGKFKTTLTDEQKRQADALRKAQFDGEEKLQKDSTQRALSILHGYYEDAMISTQAYYHAREVLELDALNKSIETERRRMNAANDPAERKKALTEIELLERQKADVQMKAQRDRAAAARELDKQLEQSRAQELENKGQTAEAARIRLEAQYRDLLNRLKEDGNTAGVDLIQGLINTGVAKARFDEIKAQFDQLLSYLARRRQEIADQVQIGAITPAVGRQQESDAQQQVAQQAGALNQQLQSMASDPNALPSLKRAAEEANAAILRLGSEGLTGFDAAAADLRAQLDQMDKGFAQAATNAGVDALTGFFTDIASGTKSAGQALRDFVRSFAASMAQIAARALATFLVLQLLDAVYPGLGKATAATMNVATHHTGGMAGTGPRRAVNPLVFAGAPRFHSGGMVGLKPDEVPAILQTGERVLNRQETAQYNSGSSQAVRNIVVFGEDELANALAGSAGERVIVTHVRNNRRAIDE